MSYRYIIRLCADMRHDCQDRVGETCGFQGWKPGETPGPFCKNYQRCHAASQGVKA